VRRIEAIATDLALENREHLSIQSSHDASPFFLLFSGVQQR
jgi:hypothetical protein